MIKRIILALLIFCNVSYASSLSSAPTDTSLVTSDITNNNVSISKHGFAPKSPNDATQFLNGDNPPVYANPASAMLVFDSLVSGSAVTSISTSGIVTLDGTTHGGYVFEIDYVYATVNAFNLDLYINNDTTNAHYIDTYVLNASPNAVAEPRLFAISNTSAYGASVHGVISIRPDGYQQCDFAGYLWSAGAFYRLSGAWIRTTTDTNITRLDWKISDGSNGIGINSRFRLWRRK